MFKKTITYTDYDGNKRTEDFYFNLSKAELTELKMSKKGGLDKMIERIIKEQDAPEIIKLVKEIILMAYGEKSDDGKYFRKSKEISEAFSQTEAYSDIFMDVCSTPDSAVNFFNSLLPSDLREQIEEAKEKENVTN